MRAGTVEAKQWIGPVAVEERDLRWRESQGHKDPSNFFFLPSDFLLVPLIGLTQLKAREAWAV